MENLTIALILLHCVLTMIVCFRKSVFAAGIWFFIWLVLGLLAIWGVPGFKPLILWECATTAMLFFLSIKAKSGTVFQLGFINLVIVLIITYNA